MYHTLLALLFSTVAQAQVQNLPDLASPTQVGRLTLYSSVQPLSWLQPIAFTADFACVGSGDQRACTIKVYNRMTAQEGADLQKLQSEQGFGVVAFSDLDDQVMDSLQQGFTGLPPQLNGQPLIVPNFRLSEASSATPYATYMFRTKSDLADQLTSQFNSGSGLGSFVTTFRLHAQRTDTYLAMKDGPCLKAKLASAAGQSFRIWSVDTLIDGAVQNCGLKTLNMVEDEPARYARVWIRDNLFDYSLTNGYQLDSALLNQADSAFVFINKSVQPLTLSCRAELLLAAGSAVKTDCQLQEVGQ